MSKQFGPDFTLYPLTEVSLSYNKNQQDAIIYQIHFWNEILHVSESSSVHHQEFFTLNTAMVYFSQI